MKKLGGCLKSVRLSCSSFSFSFFFVFNNPLSSLLEDRYPCSTSTLNGRSEASSFPFPTFSLSHFMICGAISVMNANTSPRERYSRFSNLHRTREEKDRYVASCLPSIYIFSTAGLPKFSVLKIYSLNSQRLHIPPPRCYAVDAIVTSLDVVYALKRQGRTLYGFGA